MRGKTWWWAGIGVVIIAIVVTVALARTRGSQTTRAPQAQETSQAPREGQSQEGQPRGGQPGGGQRRVPPAPMVNVGRMRARELPTTLALTATIVSLRETRIVSRVAGYLEAVNARSGDMVRAGQVVAVVEHSQLDAQVLQAEQAAMAARAAVQSAQAAVGAAHAQVSNTMAARRRAEADLQNARAALDRAKAQLGVAQAAYTRISTLYRDGLIAQSALDDARGQLQSAQAGVEAADAQIRVAQAAIEQAEAQVRVAQAQEIAAASQVRTQQAQASSLEASLQNIRLAQASATIRAPFSGIVVSRTLDTGAYVSPGGTTPIMMIADLDHVAVVVNVSEASMGVVRPGNQAEMNVDAYPGRVFKGAVARIAGGVDTDTRTAQVEIDMDNRDHAVRPGMYARVRLFGAPRRVNVVPLSALVTVGGQQFVWVVVDRKVSRRQVTIGITTATVVEITGGLSLDEKIVIRGTDLVREGGPIRIAPAEE